MGILSAEILFKKGLLALAEGDPERAAFLFQGAMDVERQRGVPRPQMRYLSYYGLALAHSRTARREAVEACEMAARVDSFNPDLFLNLGKVYMKAGRTTRALQAFERGLRLDPRHPGLVAELRKVDRRSPPPFPSLSRSHPLNRWMGKLRHSLRTAGAGKPISRKAV